MAQTLETLIVKLEADVSGLRRELNQAVDNAERGTSRISQSFTKMTNLIKGGLVAGGTIAAVRTLGSAILNLAGEAQNAENAVLIFNKQLQRSNIDVGRANQVVEGLSERFGVLPTVVQEATTLILRAGGSLDDVEKALTAAGASAAAAGSDITRAFENVSVAVATGRSELLETSGIVANLGPAQQAYAETVGKTVEQLTEQELIQARVNAIFEESKSEIEDVDALLSGLTGRQAVVTSEFAELRRELGELLLPVVTTLVGAFGSLLEGLNTIIDRLTTTKTDRLVTEYANLQSAAETATSANDELNESLRETAAAARDAALAQIATDLTLAGGVVVETRFRIADLERKIAVATAELPAGVDTSRTIEVFQTQLTRLLTDELPAAQQAVRDLLALEDRLLNPPATVAPITGAGGAPSGPSRPPPAPSPTGPGAAAVRNELEEAIRAAERLRLRLALNLQVQTPDGLIDLSDVPDYVRQELQSGFVPSVRVPGAAAIPSLGLAGGGITRIEAPELTNAINDLEGATQTSNEILSGRGPGAVVAPGVTPFALPSVGRGVTNIEAPELTDAINELEGATRTSADILANRLGGVTAPGVTPFGLPVVGRGITRIEAPELTDAIDELEGATRTSAEILTGRRGGVTAPGVTPFALPTVGTAITSISDAGLALEPIAGARATLQERFDAFKNGLESSATVLFKDLPEAVRGVSTSANDLAVALAIAADTATALGIRTLPVPTPAVTVGAPNLRQLPVPDITITTPTLEEEFQFYAETFGGNVLSAGAGFVDGIVSSVQGGAIDQAFTLLLTTFATAVGQTVSTAVVAQGIGGAFSGDVGDIIGALVAGLITLVGAGAIGGNRGRRSEVEEAALTARARTPSAIRIDFTFNQQNSLGLIDDPSTRARLREVGTDAFRQFEDVLRRNLLPRLDALEGRVFT